MKKCLLICLFLLVMPIAAFGAGAYIDGDKGYILSDTNLFEDPFFENHAKEQNPQWYVGTNTSASWNGKIPNPVTGENLIPLKGSVYIAEKETSRLFYYGSEGGKSLLSEGITSSARCFWNGSDSLLAFVRIEAGKEYYFSFEGGFASGKSPNVRFGIINSATYCSASGNVDLEEAALSAGELQKYESVVKGDGDYFMFNVYNLNRSEKTAFTGFTLYEATACDRETAENIAKIGEYITDYAPSAVEITDSDGFIHPGITMTKQDLDRMQSHVRKGDEPWISAFMDFASLAKSNKSPRIHYGDGSDEHDYVNVAYNDYMIGRLIRTDSDTCFAQTIMWYITGDDVYRENAMYILRQWSKMQSLQTMNDEQLYFGTAIYKLAFSAEILRYTPYNKTEELMWTDADTVAFTHLLELTYDKYNRWWHFMNQHGINNTAFMASAIFRSDNEDFAAAVERTTVNSLYDNPRNGSILSVIREVSYRGQTNLQHCEMGRDQGHAYGDIGALSVCAMTAQRQNAKVDPVTGELTDGKNGVSVFEFADNRLLFGANYISKYNFGIDVPFLPVEVGEKASAMWYYSINNTNRGLLYPNIGILYNFYKYELGWDMSDPRIEYVAKAYECMLPEGESQDFLGNSTLLFSGEAAFGTVKPEIAQYSQDTDVLKQFETNTREILSGTAEIKDDGETAYLSFEGSGTASFVPKDFYPAYGSILLRVRTTAPARIEVRNSEMAEDAFAVFDFSSTNGKWITAVELMNERSFWQRMTFFTVETEGTVEMDWIEFSENTSLPSAVPQYSRTYFDENRAYMYSGGQYVMAVDADAPFTVQSTMQLAEFTDYLVIRPNAGGTQKIYISMNMGDAVRYVCEEVFVFTVTQELIAQTAVNHKLGGDYTQGSMLRFNLAAEKLLAIESKTSSEFVDAANELHKADLMNNYAFLPHEKSVEPILWYDFTSVVNGKAADKSPWGNDAEVHGSAIAGGEAVLSDSAYLSLPEGMLTSSEEASVFVRFTPQSERANVFLWCIGNSSDSGYMFFNPSRPNGKARSAVTLSSYNGETAAETNALPVNTEQTALVTLGGGWLTLYVNGRLAGRTQCGITADMLGDTVQSYIGRSPYVNDGYFEGTVSDFRIYNRVLSAEEARSLNEEETNEAKLRLVDFVRDNSFYTYAVRTEADGTVYAALYADDGTLLDVCAGESGTLKGENAHHVKIFLWDEMNPVGMIYKSIE